ncbi:MAG: acetoin utilization protein AcuC [Theionarchaea archaeon]|nr:acetoin utilization protein AcuC [Theionarchaea archaeon]
MTDKPSFLYTDEFLSYDFTGMHPLKPIRLKLTYDTMKVRKTVDEFDIVEPRPATEEELLQVHTPDYVNAVKQADKGIPQFKYGLGTSDNPLFPGMYHSSLIYTGASICAAEHLKRKDMAVNISGGLHHAHPAQAAGFCIFNDPGLAIATLLKTHEKIAYVDIDAHHGDGVQEIFYRSNRVLTISLHESGQFLFPGTGFPDEIGEGEGKGYSVNIPFNPYTAADVYIESFLEVVPPLITAFQPDVLVCQLGVDTNTDDPLADFRLSIQGYLKVVELIKNLHPRRVVLGGGGYNLNVVPKAWSMAMAVLVGHNLDIPFESTYTTSDNGREYAESMVKEVKRLVFPFHGL